jgi:hypothetical protein
MRMAKAFIASVPLAIVLVAALVVPVALTPGTFGFRSWPSSRGEQISEREVRIAPRRVPVAAPQRPARRPAGSSSLASVSGRRTPATTRAVQTIAPPAQRAPTVPAPPHSPPNVSSGPGPRAHDPAPSTSGAAPAPSPPSAPPEQAPANPAPTIASGDVPVLRDAPTPAVAPPPPPVVAVVPAAPAAPASPSGEDDDPAGDDHSGLHVGLGIGHGDSHGGGHLSTGFGHANGAH